MIGGHAYTLDDVRGTVGGLGEMWRQVILGRDGGGAEPEGRALAAALAEMVGDAASDAALDDDLDRLGAIARRRVDDATASALLETALAGTERILDALRRSGQVADTGSGTVVQLSRSGGGVPKTPVPAAAVGPRGLEGDRQAVRRHHGRPYQALCLWSAGVIDAFAADGHPIGYGFAGENVTISGLDWADIGPGVRMRLGSVLAEMSFFALPCSSNAPWFIDREFGLMHHDRGPVSRIYAWVREPGAIAAGDPVELVP